MASLSSPTLERLLKEVRITLNQPSKNNSFWTDEELTMYLNDAIRVYFLEVNERSEGQFDTKVSLDLVADTETVSLPTDCFEVKALYRVFNDENKVLNYKPNIIESYGTTTSTGDSYYEPYYYFRGNDIVLRPIPGFSETGGLVLEYTQFPEVLILGSDVMPSKVSPVFKELIIMYAVYKAKIKESMVNGANTYSAAESHLADLYKTFKEDVGGRSKFPQFMRPFNP